MNNVKLNPPIEILHEKCSDEIHLMDILASYGEDGYELKHVVAEGRKWFHLFFSRLAVAPVANAPAVDYDDTPSTAPADLAGKPLNEDAVDEAFNAVKYNIANKDMLALGIITYLNAMRDLQQDEPDTVPDLPTAVKMLMDTIGVGGPTVSHIHVGLGVLPMKYRHGFTLMGLPVVVRPGFGRQEVALFKGHVCLRTGEAPFFNPDDENFVGSKS
jgi:hypothetical protein